MFELARSVENTCGPILDGLAASHTVVGVDLPGSGKTPRSEVPLSIDDLADQVVAADSEGLGRFALSGFSLGGPIAVRAASRHPERVTALVLTATFARPDNRLALAASLWRRIADGEDRELLAEFLIMMALGTDALESMPPEQLADILAVTAREAAEGTPEHAELAGRVDVRGDLPRITAPAMVISTTDDWFSSAALQRQLAETIPGAELATIGTGHLPMVQRPREWLWLITTFLRRHGG